MRGLKIETLVCLPTALGQTIATTATSQSAPEVLLRAGRVKYHARMASLQQTQDYQQPRPTLERVVKVLCSLPLGPIQAHEARANLSALVLSLRPMPPLGGPV